MHDKQKKNTKPISKSVRRLKGILKTDTPIKFKVELLEELSKKYLKELN